MSDTVLQACLVGAGSFGAHALEALRASSLVRLVGLSDRDRRLAESASKDVCPAYDDHRRVLVETSPQAVFLAVPPAPAAELARLAAQRGIHVWRQVPLSRDLPEAVQLCRELDRADRKLAVGTERRFMGSYRHVRKLLRALGRVYLVRGHYQFNQGPDLGWRGDKDAGGGALVELGYHMLDLIIWLLGMPESIHAVTGTGQRAAGEEDLPVYDSDDTGVIVMRYPGKSVAAVNVTRCFNPLSEGLMV
ncbi:MAG: Gfo/Idh/MocA family protein, partial [Planctomycetota bacterium]